MFLLVGSVSATYNTFYGDVIVEENITIYGDVIVEDNITIGGYADYYNQLTKRNTVGNIYLSGDEDTPGSLMLSVDSSTGFASIVRRLNGLWQPASFKTGPDSLWIGAMVGLAGAGHQLITEDNSGNFNFVGHSHFNGNESMSDAIMPYIYNFTVRQVYQPDNSSTWTGTSFEMIAPSSSHTLVKTGYLQTGATAATLPIRIQTWIGTDDTGPLIFNQWYPTSNFPALSEMEVAYDGYLEFSPGLSYFTRFSSAGSFSLKTNAGQTFPWVAIDSALMREDNLLQTAPWENNTSYPLGQYLINNRTIMVSNDSSVQTVSFESNSDKWFNIGSKAVMNYWTKVGNLLSHDGDVGIGGDLEVVGDIISSGTKWTNRTAAASNDWRSVTYGNGRFVAVARGGTGNRIMTSPDGITWTNRTTPSDIDWRDVTYGNGMFVAVSIGGVNDSVMTSPDGITWTIRTTPTTNQWFRVGYGNGLFVAVAITGVGNRVMTSPDGITWTIRASASDVNWRRIIYANNLFVAVADSGQVMTSPNGIDWNLESTGTSNHWQSVVYGNGMFVAVANSGTNRVMTSPNGVDWTPQISASDNPWQDIAYGDGLFVAVAEAGDSNRVMTSPNGINWTNRSSAANNGWFGVAYGNGMFVAVSWDGFVMTSGKPKQYVDPTDNIYQGGMEVRGDLEVTGNIISSGTTWTSQNGTTNKYWDEVAYGDGLFVAVGSAATSNDVMTSPDGINWNNITSTPTGKNWRGVTYGNGLFVAVASGGTADDKVMTSSNGINWTSRTTPSDNGWSDVTYDGGLFVAVGSTGSDRVMTSPDGVDWTLRTPAARAWTSITYGNGLFVAVSLSSSGTEVMTSTDGITWTLGSNPTGNWRGVTYGNGLFVVVGDSAAGTRVMTSSDGINWINRTSAANNNWYSITYGDGLFVAVSIDGVGNRVMTSPNGITWTNRTSVTDNTWLDVTYGNGVFVGVSQDGAGVMTSGKSEQYITPTGNIYQGGMEIRGDLNISGIYYGNGSGLTDVGDADYQFGSNNFNGSGNFTTNGNMIVGGDLNIDSGILFINSSINKIKTMGLIELGNNILIGDKNWIGMGDRSGRIKFDYNPSNATNNVSPIISILDANLGVRNPYAIHALDVAGNIRTGDDIIQTTGGTFPVTGTTYTTGTNPYSMSMGDVNNDGYVDIATANLIPNSVSILINDGDSTFATAVDYTTGTNPTSVSIGDVNNDGYADLAVANQGPDTVSIFINDGDGTFTAAVDYTTGTDPQSVSIGDVNNDGYVDLAVANYVSNDVSVLINNGNGTFATAVNYTTGTDPRFVSIGDVNNDGYADLATADSGAITASVLINNRDGTFASAVSYTTSSNPRSVSIGDVNNDGYADLAVANEGGPSIVSVLINNGNGTFASTVNYATGSTPFSVSIGDVNNDGYVDLATANFGANTFSVFTNNGDGTFATKVDYATGTDPTSVIIGDVNNDGYADIAVANYVSDDVSVFINNDSTTFIVDDGNVTLGQKITFAFGEIVDNIVDGWIRITGNLNVTGNIFTKNHIVSTTGSNAIEVWTLDDLPTAVGGVITLESGLYIFKDTVVFSDRIVFAEDASIEFMMTNAFQNVLIYSGSDTFLIGNGTNSFRAFMPGITVLMTGENSTFVNMTGSFGFDFSAIIFTNSGGTLGTIHGSDTGNVTAGRVLYTRTAAVGYEHGFIVENADYVNFDKGSVVSSANAEGAFLDIKNSGGITNIVGINIVLNNENASFLDIDAVISNPITISNNLLEGNGTFFQTGSLDESSKYVTAKNNGVQRDSRTLGDIFVTDNSEVTSITGPGTFNYLNLGSVSVGGTNELFTVINFTTGEMRYDGIRPFEGMIIVPISAFKAAAVAEQYNFRFNKTVGDTQFSAVEYPRDVTNKIGALTLASAISVDPNDQFRIEVENADGTSDITIKAIEVLVS